MVEILESRRLMDATLAPDAGDAGTNNGGNLVPALMQNLSGAQKSDLAHTGTLPQVIHLIQDFSNPPRGPFA